MLTIKNVTKGVIALVSAATAYVVGSALGGIFGALFGVATLGLVASQLFAPSKELKELNEQASAIYSKFYHDSGMLRVIRKRAFIPPAEVNNTVNDTVIQMN